MTHAGPHDDSNDKPWTIILSSHERRVKNETALPDKRRSRLLFIYLARISPLSLSPFSFFFSYYDPTLSAERRGQSILLGDSTRKSHRNRAKETEDRP